MERKKMVTKILELQGSAAKASSLESHNEEYGKRVSNLEDEVKRLRKQLKQVEVQKNAFERDIAVYVTENKNLKQEMKVMREVQKDDESSATRLLKEIREKNESLMALREAEFQLEIKDLKAKIKSTESSWAEKYRNLERKQSAAVGEKRDIERKMESMKSETDTARGRLQVASTNVELTKQKLAEKSAAVEELNKTIHDLREKLSNAEKSSSVGSMKTKIQIQAMEAKVKKSEDEKNGLMLSHKEELKKLQSQMEEREKQLGAQSNLNKRMQSDMKTEVRSAKQELQAEIGKNKELSNQIMRLELRIKSATENQKTTEQEGRVKIKCYEEQISVLQRDVSSKSAKLDELKKQLLEAHDENGSELQDMSSQILALKKEKRMANCRVLELTEELESTKKSMGKDIETLAKSQKDELEKLKKETTEKEKRTAAQSCISRKVQEDMKRQMENDKREVESEKLKNNNLTKEVKRLELQLRSVQDSVKSSEEDKSLSLKLAEEQVSALQKEVAIKNGKLQDLQRQLIDAQEMNGNDLEQLNDKLASANREKRTAQTKITELLEEINKAERLKSRAELSSRSNDEKYRAMNKDLEEALKKSAALEKELEEAERVNEEEVERVRSEMEQVKRENKELKGEVRQVERLQTRAEQSSRSDHDKLEKIEKELERSAGKCDDLERKLQEVRREKQEQGKQFRAELAEARTKNEKLMGEIEDARAVSVRTEQNRSNKHSAMSTELEEMRKKCTALQNELRKVEAGRDEDSETAASDLENAKQEIEDLKEEKAAIEEKFDVLRENCSVIETLEDQLDDYHNKCQELQSQNSSLIEKLAVATREKGGANRKVEKYENESQESQEKIDQLEKALEALKQTCVMMEGQIEDLEKFNNQLLQNQEEMNTEKDKLSKQFWETKKKLDEVEHLVAMEKRRGCELEEDKQEEMLQLQVKAREEANLAQELQDTVSDLERKYKLLEMHASTLQKKLNSEKDVSERLRYDVESTRSRQEVLESKRQMANTGLRAEIERADVLARERTSLQNELDTIKMKQSHESIKLNCTLAQQSKLIDFLQAKVESLEPQDKKKKKKKNDLYQVPLQYRELQDMLEESKQTNIQLQQKVNDLRTELQNAKSDVSRLKHGISGASVTTRALSPSSIAAISAIVRSPNVSTPSQTPNARSKLRMHHNIPHRLVENLCTHATKCHVCLDTLRFGRVSLRCNDCHASCHVKCRNNMTSACGLPGGLVQHYKQGGKAATASPVSCISVGGDDGNAQGWLKVLCGGSLWEKKWVQLRDGIMIIANSEKQASAKRVKVDIKDREVVDLIQQNGYVHATVPVNELDNTAKTDVPYVFKLELGPETSCWPPRNIYFLGSGFTDKQKWVAALESITTRNSNTEDLISDSKILGNKIVTMQVNEKLELNCSLPISKEKVLFGCDEGLYLLPPSTQSICDRSHMVKVTGAQQILQMEFLKSPNLIVAIEGPKRRVVTFDVDHLIAASLPSEMSVKLHPVEDTTDCHLFAVGSVEGSPHLCAASAAHIQIHRFNSQLGKFMKRQEVATSEPCTCLQFTMCSIIMGTNKFYEIELKSYKVDEFLDSSDRSLIFSGDSFPIAVLQVGQRNGKHEYLLCFHEFGVFVDGFGKRTRKNNMTWSRLPLSFAYKEPYLITTHFYSVEITRISAGRDYNDNLSVQQSYIHIPSPRYLGPAITEGAAYLSSNDCGKITVYCCKGNMEEPKPPVWNENRSASVSTPKSCLKRRHVQLAATSQESLDEDQAVAKRSQREMSMDSQTTVLSDMTNTSPSSESVRSYDTSRWTLGSKLSHFPLETTPSVPKQLRRGLRASYESIDSIGSVGSLACDASYAKYSEDDTTSTQSGASSRMMWKAVGNSDKKRPPEKPVRRAKTPNKLEFESMEL